LALLFCAACQSTALRVAEADALAIPRAVRDADRSTWTRAAIATGAIAASAALDEPAKRLAAHGSDSFAKNVEPFGGHDADRVVYAFLLGGLLTRNENARNTGIDALAASLLSSHIVTPVLKQAISRKRPNGGDESFPSNHATQAFAVASVVAAHYDQWWIDATAYGLASAVGYARMHHRAHYLSDVVGGAVIGTSIGRLMVRTNMKILPSRRGVAVAIHF